MTASTAQPKPVRIKDHWTVTPVQAVLGRRVGFRNHWLYWASGLSLMFVVGNRADSHDLRAGRTVHIASAT